MRGAVSPFLVKVLAALVLLVGVSAVSPAATASACGAAFSGAAVTPPRLRKLIARWAYGRSA